MSIIKPKKILIMGLPGAGKTTLSLALAPLLNAVHYNADAAREVVSKDLGFTVEGRIEHARRMGWMCDQVVKSDHYAIADFVCPTEQTRAAFEADNAFVIWVDRIKEGRFEDTNKMFDAPKQFDVRVTAEGTPEFWAHKIHQILCPAFNSKASTAFLVGRFQPFHQGHLELIKASLERVGQVCIGVRDTQGIDDKNPFGFHEVRARLEAGLRAYTGRFLIIPIPNITHIHYGRDVGYVIERINLDDQVEQISATKLRKKMFDGEAA